MDGTHKTWEANTGRRRISRCSNGGAELSCVYRPERSCKDAFVGLGSAVPARQQRRPMRSMEAHEAARLEVGRYASQSQGGIAGSGPDCGNSQGRTPQQIHPLRVDLVCPGPLRWKARHQAARVPAWCVYGEQTTANNQAEKRNACYAHRSKRGRIATPTVVRGGLSTTPTVAIRSLSPLLSTTPAVVLLRITICTTIYRRAA